MSTHDWAPGAQIPEPLSELPPPPPTSSGRQPGTLGPYFAVVRGPGGLDVSIAGSAEIIAAQLRGLADTLAPRPPKGPAYRQL